MKLFIVRHIQDKQAVGVFWAGNSSDLPEMVDEVSEPTMCEFQEIVDGCAFVWDGHAPPIGVHTDEEELDRTLQKLMCAMGPAGSIEDYFYGSKDTVGWLPVEGLLHKISERPVRLPKKQPKLAPAATPTQVPVAEAALNTVYFIECDGHIKIGVTSGSVQRRMKALSTAHHRPLTLLATISDPVGDLEFSLHQRFAALRVRGEWFRAEPELLDYIETVKAKP